MIERGDPITVWPEDLHVKLFGPLADEETKVVEEEEENFLSQMIMIDDFNVPFSHFKVHNGSKLELVGDIKFESDRPKTCFTFEWKEGSKNDFFKCLACNQNWICENCA